MNGGSPAYLTPTSPITLQAAHGNGYVGGTLNLAAGDGNVAGNGGAGGTVDISAGDGVDGGAINLTAGGYSGGNTGTGGNVTITGGSAQYNTSTAGHVILQGGAGTFGSAVGGSILLLPGVGPGATGKVGIGATNPTANLDISTASGNTTFILHRAAAGTTASDGLEFGLGGLNEGYFWNYENSYIVFGTNNAESMRILANGNVAIGTTSASQKLEVNGNVLAAAYLYTSDRRLKTDIKDIDGLETILNLRGVKFRWKETGANEIGLIAQEVEEVAPDLVVTNAITGMKSVKYGNIVAPLIEATKELYGICKDTQEKVEKHDRDIASLKEENQSLKSKNDELEARVRKLETLMEKVLEQKK